MSDRTRDQSRRKTDVLIQFLGRLSNTRAIVGRHAFAVLRLSL
jgi:hypothetical protein